MHHDPFKIGNSGNNWWGRGKQSLQALSHTNKPFLLLKKGKWMFFPQNNWNDFNPRWEGNSNAMDMSTSLLKATTKANKERYKREGQCFFCRVQGHVSHRCPKKPSPTLIKTNQAKIATITTTKETILTKPETTMLTFNQKSVLNYLKDLSSEEY